LNKLRYLFKKSKKILVVSHERSGTHFLINTIAYNFPWYSNKVITLDSKDIINPDEDTVNSYIKEVEYRFKKYFGKRVSRIFKSHHQYYFFKDYINELLDEFIIFYLVRNVNDTLTSLYYYFKWGQRLAHKPFPVENDFSKLIRLKPYMYPTDGVNSVKKSENFIYRWINHVESWLEAEGNINIVKYEALKRDPGKVISQIAEVLKEDMPERIVIPQLKKSPSIFPRKGIIGDWKNIFEKEDAELTYKLADDTMKKLGYSVWPV